MANASNAIIYLEQGQVMVNYALMTDSGDHKTFNSAADTWSGRSGFEPIVRPNGVVSGRNLVIPSAAGTDNLVDTLAFTAYSKGVLKSPVATQGQVIVRPATDVAKISSITMTDAGAIAVVAGTSAADAVFIETRGGAGGPPVIPVDSVELAQIRLTTAGDAPITESQIFQVVGQHCERYDFPVWQVNNIGLGETADTAAEEVAFVKFASVLPLSHTSSAAKRVYIKYYTPTFGELAKTLDFVPAETSHSVSSTQYYNGTIASKSSSLGQGGFTALLDSGVVDGLIAAKDEVLTVKFFPNRDQTPYILTQGAIGLSRTFPVSDQIQASVTITSESPSAEFAG